MSQRLLKVENIDFSYSNKKILENFSLSLNQGEKILISGPNGSGKTTLLKCIMGLLKIEAGSIEKAKNLKIAYCKQDFNNTKFPISALEVVSMGSKNKEDIEEALALTGTKNLKDRDFFSLSGGEKQRVSLARCFCQKANLLLFDEPSSYLDAESKNTFEEMMKNLPDDISAIVVTHDQDLVESLGWKNILLKEKNNG